MHCYVLNAAVAGVRASVLQLPRAISAAAQDVVAGESPSLASVLAHNGAVSPLDFSSLAEVFRDASTSKALKVEVATRMRYRFAKTFHVSPFFPLSHEYDWIFTEPSDTLLVQSQNVEVGNAETGPQRMLNTQLRMTRCSTTLSSLLWCAFIAYPFLTFRIQMWIHWEAAKLWVKGAPLFPHPLGTTTMFTTIIEMTAAVFMFLVNLASKLTRMPFIPRLFLMLGVQKAVTTGSGNTDMDKDK
jgi:hypothetical protein